MADTTTTQAKSFWGFLVNHPVVLAVLAFVIGFLIG